MIAIRRRSREAATLTPWDTNDNEPDYLYTQMPSRTPILPRLPLRPRPSSNCLPEEQNKKRIRIRRHLQQKPFQTVANKVEKPMALQEITVRNFIIEGGWPLKNEHTRRRESSYILKQKFAEIRRSVNLVTNKENCNLLKVVRYE